ncbi:MAG: hypothetical protein PF795_09940 [Kiritimatiellae bacterium]|nr:hypothetical protein [Kiritimatiellia bacterium]
MDKYDVIATVALQDLDREMRLRKRVTEPAYAFYCRGGILGIMAYILVLCGIVWVMSIDGIPVWGAMTLAFALTGILESQRQRERFNALVKLMEIEKNKPQANKSLEDMVHKLSEPKV